MSRIDNNLRYLPRKRSSLGVSLGQVTSPNLRHHSASKHALQMCWTYQDAKRMPGCHGGACRFRLAQRGGAAHTPRPTPDNLVTSDYPNPAAAILGMSLCTGKLATYSLNFCKQERKDRESKCRLSWPGQRTRTHTRWPSWHGPSAERMRHIHLHALCSLPQRP